MIFIRAARAAGLAWMLAGWATAAPAQVSDGVVRIGVLTDPGAGGGRGSIVAAQMAAQDFGGTVRDRPIEIISSDEPNKPDVAATLARRWFDLDKVDAIVDLPFTALASAVQTVAREKGRTVMITAAAASDLTAHSCSLTSTHWADDTVALTAGSASAIIEQGGKTWFFIAIDQPIGQALQRDASKLIESHGGKVLGSARQPPGTSDFASLLMQARSSGAEVIALASSGADLAGLIRQAHDFEAAIGRPQFASFLLDISDVHALGLSIARNLTVASSFYWDRNEPSRAFARRFLEATGTMPTRNHAAVYTAVTHYLKAVNASGGDDAPAVNRAMRQLPVDYFGRPATVRADGRVLYDLTLYRVKTPAESSHPWDYFEPLRTVARQDAFLPMNAACEP
jgi:branched-chain amino acid transport system substrate-binding protein